MKELLEVWFVKAKILSWHLLIQLLCSTKRDDAPLRGRRITKSRGGILLKRLSRREIWRLRIPEVSSSGGVSLGSVVNFKKVSTILARRVVCFVSEHCIHSDHQAIFFRSKMGMRRCELLCVRTWK